MTLPASFPLSVGQIAAEYGLTLPVSLRAFIGQSGYPASGPISMSDFLGKSASPALSVFISGAPTGSRVGTGGVTTSAATASATGGTPGYSYAWTYVSGTAFTIDSPTSAATTFTQTVTAGATIGAVYRCTVTDSLGATAFSEVAVNASASVVPPALAASKDSDAFAAIFGPGTAVTNTVTVSPVNGTFPFTYAWTYVSGDVFSVASPSTATTSFSTTLSTVQVKTAVYRCTITDSLGATAFADVDVTATETS